MTQKSPVSICASPQLCSMEVGASPQFLLGLSAVAAGGWRGGRLPGSAPGSGRGLAFPRGLCAGLTGQRPVWRRPISSLVFIQDQMGPGP